MRIVDLALSAVWISYLAACSVADYLSCLLGCGFFILMAARLRISYLDGWMERKGKRSAIFTGRPPSMKQWTLSAVKTVSPPTFIS